MLEQTVKVPKLNVFFYLIVFSNHKRLVRNRRAVNKVIFLALKAEWHHLRLIIKTQLNKIMGVLGNVHLKRLSIALL